MAQEWQRGATPRPRSGVAAALCWSSRERYPTSKVTETQVRQWVLRESIRGQTD